MNVRARLERIARTVPAWMLDESSEERNLRLAMGDDECIDLIVRISQDRARRFNGIDKDGFEAVKISDPLQVALHARLSARLDELLAGAKPTDDGAARHRWRIEGVLPPGVVVP